jgi:hypothetical protein
MREECWHCATCVHFACVKINSPWPRPQQSKAPVRTHGTECSPQPPQSFGSCSVHTFIFTCTTRIRNHMDTIRIHVRGRVQHHADRMQEAGATSQDETRERRQRCNHAVTWRASNSLPCQSEKRAKYNKAAPFCPDTSHSRSLRTSLTTDVVLYKSKRKGYSTNSLPTVKLGEDKKNKNMIMQKQKIIRNNKERGWKQYDNAKAKKKHEIAYIHHEYL